MNHVYKKMLICSFILLFLSTYLFSQSCSNCYLPGWEYSKKVIIDNSSNSQPLTDYQVLVVFDSQTPISNGKMNGSGDDLRFMNGDCSAMLDYWIESGINTTNTRVWVKVPGIPANQLDTIYMFYGNTSAAPGSNGDSTFVFFDDFEDAMFSEYTTINGPGNLIQNTATFGYGVASVTVNTHIYSDIASISMSNYAVEAEFYQTSDYQARLLARSDGTNNNWYAMELYTSGIDFDAIIGGSYSTLKATSSTYSINTWTTMSFRLYNDSLKAYVDNNLAGKMSDDSLTSGRPGLMFNRNNSEDQYMDKYRVRKYTLPEPKASVTNEVSIIAADFSVTSICSDFPAQFSDSSWGGITSWKWYFGDGDSAATQNPSHTYPDTGTYTATLTITDTIGCQSTASQAVTIITGSVNASFTASTTCLGDSTSFFGVADSAITQWKWTFDNNDTAVVQNPKYYFTTPGWHQACLRVTDTLGCTDSTCNLIYVHAPNANFGVQTTGLSADFTDSSAMSVNQWQWSFGNGDTSGQQSPSMTYDSAGTYQVCLTVQDTNNCTDSICRNVSVSSTGITDHQSYTQIHISPNPFQNKISLQYHLNEKAKVRITLYSITGAQVKTLVDEIQAAGNYHYSSLNVDGISPGVYIMKVKVGSSLAHHKLVKTSGQ